MRACARWATGPASGSSSATTRCSCENGWAPISSTTVEPRSQMTIRRTATPQPDDGRRSAMDTSRNDLLGEIAGDAALERSDFIVQATEQLRKFLNANKERINEIGGLVLIDDDPDYLSIAPDLTFRSRTRYLDDLTG